MSIDSRMRSVDVRTVVGLGVAATVICLVTGFAFAYPSMGRSEFRLTASVIIPATIALMAPVLTALAYRPYDIFHPLNFVGLSLFFGVFGRSFFLLNSRSEVAQDLLEGYPIEAIIPGAFLSAAGSLLICAGFALAGRVSLRLSFLGNLFSRMNNQRLYVLLPIFFLVSAVATFLFLKATGFQYTGLASLSAKRRILINGVESSLGYHRLLAQDLSRVVLLILTAIYMYSSRRSGWLKLGLAMFALLAIALPFLASSRANVLLAVIAVCVVINRIRGISTGMLFFCGLLSVVTLTGMLALRRENNRGIAASESIVNMGMEPLFGNKNFACVVKLGHMYQSVPDLIDYQYGKTYLTILYAPIPRTMWRSKPSILMGRMITEKVYNRGMDMKDKGGGTPPGMFSEAIINFGIFGFPFVVFFMGYMLRVLYNSLSNLADESVAGIGLYAAVMPAFTLQLMSGEFSTAAIKLGIGLGLVVCIAMATRVKLVV